MPFMQTKHDAEKAYFESSCRGNKVRNKKSSPLLGY